MSNHCFDASIEACFDLIGIFIWKFGNKFKILKFLKEAEKMIDGADSVYSI